MYLVYSLIGSLLGFGIACGRIEALTSFHEAALKRSFIHPTEAVEIFAFKALRAIGRWAVARDLSLTWFLGTLIGFLIKAFN